MATRNTFFFHSLSNNVHFYTKNIWLGFHYKRQVQNENMQGILYFSFGGLGR